MKLKNVFMLTITMLFTHIVTSQEGLPIYTDYLTDNYYLIHPSMAGAANCAKVRLTARQQWFGQDDAPKLLTMSVNSRIGDTPSAIGGILFTDKLSSFKKRLIKSRLNNISKGKINVDYKMRFPNPKKGR